MTLYTMSTTEHYEVWGTVVLLSLNHMLDIIITGWWGTGMVICVERDANDLHMVQLMPLPPRYLLLQ